MNFSLEQSNKTQIRISNPHNNFDEGILINPVEKEIINPAERSGLKTK